MSYSHLIDPATGKIADQFIPEGGGINLDKGQLITALANQTEVAFPDVPPANGSVLSYDATTDTGLRYIANNPTALALDFQQLFSATAGNNITAVPASAHNNYVLTSDNTDLLTNPTGLVWKAVAGSGVISTNEPLYDEEVANVSTISINFTAGPAGQIPYGTGVARTGALTDTPTSGTQILGVAQGVPAWIDAGGSGVVTATAPLIESAGVGGASNIAINFATKGEIPVGTGAGTGALLPLTATDGFVLTAENGDTNGMIWKSVGSTLAISNFFPITLPLGVVPPNYPISQAGGSNELVLGTPVLLSATNPAFTQNQIITIQNQTAIDSNPSANTFLMPQMVPSTVVKPGYASASYCGEGVKAFDGYWWSCESEGALTALCYSPLPLTTNSTSTLIAQIATGTSYGGQQLNCMWATEDFIYCGGIFGQFTVVATSTVVTCKDIFKINKVTGVLSICGAGTASCIGLDGNVVSGIACPTTDKAQGNYLASPRSCVIGGDFLNTFGGVALSCRKLVFYTEATDTFSVVGAVAGDGLLDTTVGPYNSFVGCLFYNDDTNCLYITGAFVGGTIINGVANSTPNYITGFAWNVIAGPAFSVAVPVGTVGQITNNPDSPQSYIVQGWVVEKLIDNPVGSAGFWLCFNYYLNSSTSKDNCSWVKVSTGGVPEPNNPFLPASTGLAPLQPVPPNNNGSNLPGTLIGPIHYSDDQTAWANIGIQAYSVQPNPDIQLWKCSGGIWSFANVNNLLVYNCPLYVPNLSLPTDQAVVCNTGFLSNPPPGTPTTLLQVDLDSEAESVNLYVESPATIVAYDAGARLTTEYAKVAFGNAYSNIQLAVDVANNRYSLINSLGNVVLIK